MEARPGLQPRVFIQTLGCPKNEVDSRSLARTLTSAGIELTEEPERATHIIVNTCGFIQDAKEESIAAILDVCAAFPHTSVLVTGCLVERYRAELAAGIPEAAEWFGVLQPAEQERLLRVLQSSFPEGAPCRTGESYSVAGGPQRGGTRSTVPPKTGRARSAHAYLKISDGCDGPCTFCAIPGIKGPYYSVGTAEILAEARACIAEGARELVLVGQNTACWSSDGLDLCGLIELLAAEEGVSWIRVMYLQPDHLTDDFLAYMSRQPKLCRYLDVPFQHSHPQLLARMGRQGEAAMYLRLLDQARRLMPDVAVRSAFIVGFPGETEEHFQHLLDFVSEAAFDYAGGFIYSPEEGTRAAGLHPRVRRAVAVERLNRLEALLVDCAEQAHRRLIGTKMEVMIDSLDPEEAGEGFVAVGRVRGQAPEVDGVTYIEGTLPEGLAVGDVIEVRIESAVGYDLVGCCDLS